MNTVNPRFLEHSLELYMPTVDNQGHPIDSRKTIAYLETLVCSLFGGATIFPVHGLWLNESRIVISERIYILQSSFSSKSLSKLLAIVSAFSIGLTKLNQGEIAFKIDGQLITVPCNMASQQLVTNNLNCIIGRSWRVK